jgi:microcystin-dependent protein
MSEPFLGQITLFPYNFAPLGWLDCAGQLLPISQYTALFSLVGTYYGGNGTSNFALPNLLGRVPVGQGQGRGLSLVDLGQMDGEENVTLIASTMPVHTHALQAVAGVATAAAPAGALFAEGKGGGRGSTFEINNLSPVAANTTLPAAMIGPAGGNQPHNNIQPTLVMRWCIAINGVYPARP